jgi:hypothetical protein
MEILLKRKDPGAAPSTCAGKMVRARLRTVEQRRGASSTYPFGRTIIAGRVDLPPDHNDWCRENLSPDAWTLANPDVRCEVAW